MQGHPDVVNCLIELLRGELGARDQYFLHSRLYEDMGYAKLYERINHEMEEETQHADAILKRILFLEGIPNLQDLGKLNIGENCQEMLESDLKIEHKARADLQEAIPYCESVRDYVSRDLFIKILDDEEEHIDKLEAELGLIDKVGIQNYLQKHMFTTDKE